MHVVLTSVLSGFAVWKGDWRHWQKYIPTIFYVITCNLLYCFFCKNHYLWRLNPDAFPKTNTVLELMYTFINLPAVTLLFLTHFPFSKPYIKQAKYISAWIAGAFIVEYPFYHYNRILMQHGYEYWMEIIFYVAMFSLIRLHYTRPFLTYGISAAIIVFLLHHFNVPIK